jgi:phospholipid/cholesterol/gamma-HCH transport system substrate-binding protein
MRIQKLEPEVKVGIFVSFGLLLVMLSILMLGGLDSLFVRQIAYRIYFAETPGLVTGSRVDINGIRVGVVETIDYHNERNEVEVGITISSKYTHLVKEDSFAGLVTQGVLGDKYISVSAGSQLAKTLEGNSEIKLAKGKGLQDFLDDGGNLVTTLGRIANSFEKTVNALEANGRSERLFEGLAKTASNLSMATDKVNRQLEHIEFADAVKNLNSILKKVINGTGSLGALINDPSLYDDAKSLMTGMNRSRLMRNLVRQTVKDGEEVEEVPKK